ncbi:C40 family peptidase [Jongsikchunia kroppenstedtii]|uniref:C40 family peptidase n=1 Tax=Jongsikchunia kroppenstedtii TaxID=1121721 RepID=UPI0004760510|nr:C40 family peptidase [Jongsikchunia kroppenstedtii]
MAKHRVETGRFQTARTAVIAGSLTLGAVAVGAGPALATPVSIPGVGNFDVPGVDAHQIPDQFKAKPDAPLGLNVAIPNFAPNSAVPGVNNAPGKVAASAAQTRIGDPYVYGASGPNAFDCSGLVFWSYKQAGKTIPRDSYGQLGGGTPVSLNDLQPGDIIIYNGGGHSGMYVGDGMVVHSSTEGVPVRKVPLHNPGSIYAARRY